MVYIYVLALEYNKYYVGKTNNPYFRLQNHLDGHGSAWTIKYKPIKLIEIISNCDDYDEDKYTMKYMDKYGIDNVRGGSYVTIKLDLSTKKHLEKINRSINDKCFSCGMKGHFIKDCPEQKCRRDNLISSCFAKTHIDKSFGKNVSECERCGRDHLTSFCYTKTHINGIILQETMQQVQKEETLQQQLLRLQKEFDNIHEIECANNVCSKCKRKGHYRLTCYEDVDINGYPIDQCIIS